FQALRELLAGPLPHPDPTTLRQWTSGVVDWLLEHFTMLAEMPVGRTASRAEMEGLLREGPPEVGRSFEQVLREFHERVAPYAFHLDHPRFLAFVPSAPTFVSVLGDLLSAGTNYFAAVWLEAAGPAQVELVVLDWFKEFLSYPIEAGGLITSGGSEANLTALVVARERLDFAERARAVLYVTEQRHGSVDRAARVIGLRPDQLHPLPTDEQFRLCPEVLAAAVGRHRSTNLVPWALAANAGATNTGTIDPLDGLAAVCRREGLWFH